MDCVLVCVCVCIYQARRFTPVWAVADGRDQQVTVRYCPNCTRGNIYTKRAVLAEGWETRPARDPELSDDVSVQEASFDTVLQLSGKGKWRLPWDPQAAPGQTGTEYSPLNPPSTGTVILQTEMQTSKICKRCHFLSGVIS